MTTWIVAGVLSGLALLTYAALVIASRGEARVTARRRADRLAQWPDDEEERWGA